jgi:hypothetical protein
LGVLCSGGHALVERAFSCYAVVPITQDLAPASEPCLDQVNRACFMCTVPAPLRAPLPLFVTRSSRVGASEASPLSMRVVARKSGAHSSVCRQRHTPSIAWGTRAVPLAIQWGGFFMLHAQPIWRAFVHPVLFSETGRRNQNSKSKSGEFSVVSLFNVTFFFLVTIILPWLNMHRGNATKRRDARAKCRRSCEPEQNSASNDDGSDDDFGIDESHSRRNKGDLKPSKHPQQGFVFRHRSRRSAGLV